MDRAWDVRHAHEEHKERERVRHPITGEPMGLGGHARTIREILGDRQEEDLYVNHFLYNRDPDKAKEIGTKRANNETLSEDNEKFLDEGLAEWNDRCAVLEHVENYFTGKEVKKMALADPRIKRIMDQIGEDDAADFLRSEVRELATEKDGRKFKKIAEELRAVAEIEDEKRFIKLDLRVKRELENRGLTQERYKEAAAPGLSQETRANFNKIVAGQLQGWKKALNFVSFGAVAKWGGGKLYANFAEEERYRSDCEEHLAAVAKVLHGTIDDRMRKIIQDNTWENRPLREKRMGNIVTIPEYRNLRDACKIETIDKEFKKYRKAEAAKLGNRNNRKHWDEDGDSDLTDVQKDKIKAVFVAERDKRRTDAGEGRGLTEVLLQELFPRPREYKTELRVAIDSIA